MCLGFCIKLGTATSTAKVHVESVVPSNISVSAQIQAEKIWNVTIFQCIGSKKSKLNKGFIFARFFGKCKQVFVRDYELDDFLYELDKNFQWVRQILQWVKQVFQWVRPFLSISYTISYTF